MEKQWMSQCPICSSKISKFIKKQETSGILSSVVIRTPLSKILFFFKNLFLSAISLSAIPLSAISFSAILLRVIPLSAVEK